MIGPVPLSSFWRSWPNKATTTLSERNRQWPSPSTFQSSKPLQSKSFQSATGAAAANPKSECASNIRLPSLRSLHPSRYPHIRSSARYGATDRISRNSRTALPLRSRCRRCTCPWHQLARGGKLTPPCRPAPPAWERPLRLARARHGCSDFEDAARATHARREPVVTHRSDLFGVNPGAFEAHYGNSSRTPRMNQSLFRLNTDSRYSNSQSPRPIEHASPSSRKSTRRTNSSI